MGKGRSGIYAAVAAIAATTGLGAVGAAGADELAPAHIYARDSGGLCFSEDPTATQCTAGETADVMINTGETVTFHFVGTQPHNAASSSGPAWKAPDTGYPSSGTATETFNNPGTYPFYCEVHPTMTGVVRVEGEPIPTQTPTPTATVTATPTPSPPSSPPPTGGTTTPDPTGGDDTVKPRVTGVRPKALRRAVRVRFTLSEPATVTIRVKRGRKVLKSARVQARAGARSVTLRSKKLKKGRYTVEIQARDAFGNRSSLASKRLRLPR